MTKTLVNGDCGCPACCGCTISAGAFSGAWGWRNWSGGVSDVATVTLTDGVCSSSGTVVEYDAATDVTVTAVGSGSTFSVTISWPENAADAPSGTFCLTCGVPGVDGCTGLYHVTYYRDPYNYHIWVYAMVAGSGC